LTVTEENQATLEDHEYFFSELDRIVTLLAENCREHFDICPEQPFEESATTVITAESLV
jgi:hypothetical protein